LWPRRQSCAQASNIVLQGPALSVVSFLLSGTMQNKYRVFPFEVNISDSNLSRS
jgi:hypothetical protein